MPSNHLGRETQVTNANRFLARHAATMADLDATFDGALVRIDRMVRDCPPAPTLHARINDAGLESTEYAPLALTTEIPCELGEANTNPERPPQCWPLQDESPWVAL